MPPDFSTYIALSAQPDIAAQRTYQQQNAEYARQMAAFADFQAQQKGAAIKEIGDYFGAVDQQINELLPEDMKRVQGVWDKNKQAVIDKLKEFGNDPQMFMRMGGATVVKKFANDFYRSPEMQNAINTKEQLTAGLKDFANPKLELRNVSWTDKNGATQTGSLAEWTKAHQNGDAIDLHYNGAYDKPNIDPLEFAKIPNGGKPVTHSQLFDFMVMKGTAPGDAADYIKKAAPHIMDPNNPNNTVFNWGSWKPTKPSGATGGWGIQHEMPTLNDSQTFNTPFRANGKIVNTNLTGKEGFRMPPKKITLSNVYVKQNNPDASDLYDTDVTGAYFTGAYKFPVANNDAIVSDGSKDKVGEKYFAVIQVPEKSVKGTLTFDADGNFVDAAGVPAQMKTFYVPLHGSSGVGIRQQIFKNPANVNNPIWDSGTSQQQQSGAPTKGMKKTFAEGPATFDGTKWVLDTK